MAILPLLVAIVVLCLLYWAINAILRAFGVGDPIATVVRVIFVVVAVLWALSALGVGSSFHLR